MRQHAALLSVAMLLDACAGFTLLSPARSHSTAAIYSNRRVTTFRAGAVPTERMSPLSDQVLVDLQSYPTETKAGVLLPTAFQEKEEFGEMDQFIDPEVRAGTVVAVGPGAVTKDGKRAIMPDIQVGQKIVVSPTAGIRLQQEGNASVTIKVGSGETNSGGITVPRPGSYQSNAPLNDTIC